ncbi:hypothetical protein HPB51_015648 [Rhipicephalus microplus]|uniref:Uncharacterized protein n=1 Tax=Rhipicephalus microplus TaxID=6941 RepID=A0A9J6DB02_RHIMP|nr:hypothetical protein HPB51_015648 [Rhipicephalus microplus]
MLGQMNRRAAGHKRRSKSKRFVQAACRKRPCSERCTGRVYGHADTEKRAVKQQQGPVRGAHGAAFEAAAIRARTRDPEGRLGSAETERAYHGFSWIVVVALFEERYPLLCDGGVEVGRGASRPASTPPCLLGGHPVVTPVPLLATAALLLGSTTTGSSDCYDVITAHHVTLRDTRKRVAMACGRLLTDLEGHKAGVKTYTRAPLRATQTPADSR